MRRTPLFIHSLKVHSSTYIRLWEDMGRKKNKNPYFHKQGKILNELKLNKNRIMLKKFLSNYIYKALRGL